jgi:hypothetical protein
MKGGNMDAYNKRQVIKDMAKGVLVCLIGLTLGILGVLAYGLLPR